MTRTLLAAALILAACKGDGVDDPQDSVDTDNPSVPAPTPTADTGFQQDFEPAGFSVSQAAFAIDESNSARPYTGLDQTGAPVSSDVLLVVTIINEDAAATGMISAANSCSVVLSTPNTLPPASWIADAGIWWGFELPADAAVVDDTCSDLTFPAEWGGNVGDVVSQHRWGFGLTTMLPQVQTQLETQLAAQWATIEPAVVGAGWYSSVLEGQPSFPGAFANGGFALGSQVDANFAVTVDAQGQPILLSSGEVYVDSSTPLGVGGYTGQGLSFIQPAAFLLNPSQ